MMCRLPAEPSMSLLTCPTCEKRLRVPDDRLGRLVRCPSCKTTFTAEVPNEEEEAIASEPPEEKEEAITSEPRDKPSAVTREPSRPRRRRIRRDEDLERRGAPHQGGLTLGLGIGSLVLAALGALSGFCCTPLPMF